MTSPRMECKNVVKSFLTDGQTRSVLRGVSFSVAPGETVVISGKSGQGKSVLLWLLSGLDRPDSGEIIFEGTNLNTLNESALAELRRSRIGMMFQTFNLIPTWTAVENIQAALLKSGLSTSDQRSTCEAMLDRLGLSGCYKSLPSQLSVGQQQRVALARALINQPSLIIADEPTGSVDDETAQDALRLVREYIQSNSASMIVATHGPYPALESKKHLVLSDGTLSEIAYF